MDYSGFYFITDSKLTKQGIIKDVADALAAGAKIIQYREKDKCVCDMEKEASEIKNLCAGKAKFIINDDLALALACGADGVHLGQDDGDVLAARTAMKEGIIGVTVHDVSEACEAEENGADYLGVSPIFLTDTKTDAGEPSGLSIIKDIKSITHLPIIAIGGINLENAAEVISAGAESLCAISATVATDDIKCAVKAFNKIIQK
jgi:thiamine-phosphate pyrophosphorylase